MPELKLEILIDVCGVDYQTYGKDEWQTNSATGTGFSRGTLRDDDPPPAEDAEQAHLPPARYDSPSSITCCRSRTITACA